MDLLFDNFHIVVFILIGLGSMVKSALEAKAKKNAEREFEVDPDSGAPLDEDTSYRKVLPKATPHHPPPLPRQEPPPLLSMAGYEAAQEAAAALKHQQELAERLRQIRETKATTTGGAAATRARIAAKGVAKPMMAGPVSVRGSLRDPAEVRRAFVLREILGPPVALR